MTTRSNIRQLNPPTINLFRSQTNLNRFQSGPGVSQVSQTEIPKPLLSHHEVIILIKDNELIDLSKTPNSDTRSGSDKLRPTNWVWTFGLKVSPPPPPSFFFFTVLTRYQQTEVQSTLVFCWTFVPGSGLGQPTVNVVNFEVTLLYFFIVCRYLTENVHMGKDWAAVAFWESIVWLRVNPSVNPFLFPIKIVKWSFPFHQWRSCWVTTELPNLDFLSLEPINKLATRGSSWPTAHSLRWVGVSVNLGFWQMWCLCPASNDSRVAASYDVWSYTATSPSPLLARSLSAVFWLVDAL